MDLSIDINLWKCIIGLPRLSLNNRRALAIGGQHFTIRPSLTITTQDSPDVECKSAFRIRGKCDSRKPQLMGILDWGWHNSGYAKSRICEGTVHSSN